MPNRIEFDGSPTADGQMVQWKGRNIGSEALGAASTHDYVILFDSDNNLVFEEKVTRQGDLAPGDSYDSFTYLQLPVGDYAGYLTLDQDGDDDAIADRQAQLRVQVLEDRVIVY